MSYPETMTIEHQIVIDADGNPVAAQIPWAEFEALLEELEHLEDSDEATPEEAEAIEEAKKDRAEGNEDAFIDLDTFMAEFKD